MDGVVGAAATVRRAGVLARGLSHRRRSGCRLATVGGAACSTDLRDVLMSWPLPAGISEHPHGLAAVVALQASPTKEAVAQLHAHAFSVRELAALQLCEGAAALGWVGAEWPGLTDGLAELTRGLAPAGGDWRCVTGTDLAERAQRLSRERRGELDVPTVLGALPLRFDSNPISGWVQRRLGRRLRVVGDALERIGDAVGEPIAIEGAEQEPGPNGRAPVASGDSTAAADAAGPGIPFPEWDESAQTYRRDFTRVVEFRGPRGGRAFGGRACRAPELESWFRVPLERRWRGRLRDGADVDIDAVVDAMIEADADPGASVCEHLYRDRVRAERDVACAILIDSSGSLAQAALLEREVACADVLVDAMDRAGEQNAVFAFWSNGRHQVALNVVRDFGETATPPSAARLRPTHHTRLGAAIRGVTARLRRQPAARRVLLVLTDGVPFDDGYEGDYACADVAKAVHEAEQDEIAVALLCVNTTQPPLHERLHDRLHRVDRLDDLAPALGDVHERLVA